MPTTSATRPAARATDADVKKTSASPAAARTLAGVIRSPILWQSSSWSTRPPPSLDPDVREGKSERSQPEESQEGPTVVGEHREARRRRPGDHWVVAPAGRGRRRVCHGAPATSAPVDHAPHRGGRCVCHGTAATAARRGRRGAARGRPGRAARPVTPNVGACPPRRGGRTFRWSAVRRNGAGGGGCGASGRARRRRGRGIAASPTASPAAARPSALSTRSGLGTDSASRPSSRQPVRKSCPPAPPPASAEPVSPLGRIGRCGVFFRTAELGEVVMDPSAFGRAGSGSADPRTGRRAARALTPRVRVLGVG